jgi:transcriptional regulator with XRE-family HTH domain
MVKAETLGRRLQRLRLSAGLTQEGLARKAGLPVWSLRNWEHDHRLPGVAAVYKLARVLGVPMEELAVCVVGHTGRGKTSRGRGSLPQRPRPGRGQG